MNQKTDIITNIPPSDKYSEIVQIHKRLNKEIDQMGQRVAAVLDKSQGQFILAYQSHIRKIKMELNQIRKKSDAHEQQMSKHDRIGYLEKHVTLFRQQSLKLYSRLQQKTQQAQIYKLKAKQLEKSCFIAQKQVKQNMRQRKIVQAKLVVAQQRIRLLQQQLASKEQQLYKGTFGDSQNTKSIYMNNLNIRLKQQRTKQATPNKTTAQGVRRRSVNLTSAAGGLQGQSQYRSDWEIKDWFLQCVKTIKKDVAQRKNSGQQLNLQLVQSIQQFKMIDKLRLFQKFLQNQKLLVWMYQKIFPSRSGQIRQYLVKNNLQQPTKKHSIQSQHLLPQSDVFDEGYQQRTELALPKMSQIKQRRSEIRNRIQVKDGKLNLSLL